PTLALHNPAGVASSGGVAGAGNGLPERSIGILRILLERPVSEPLLIAELHATEVQHRVLHCAGDPLTPSCLLTLVECRPNSGHQVNAGPGIADLRPGHEWNAIDLTRRRGRSAGTLRDVLIDLPVFVGTGTEPLYRRVDHARVDLLDFLPREAHAIDGARGVVLDHHVALLDQLREDALASLGLRVQRDGALVAVQHREIQAVDPRNVAQLAPRRIALAGPLDLDDVGSKPRQNLGAGRSRLHVSH